MGDLIIDDRNISTLDEGELTRLRSEKIGFIFQTFNLLPSLTVRDKQPELKDQRSV